MKNSKPTSFLQPFSKLNHGQMNYTNKSNVLIPSESYFNMENGNTNQYNKYVQRCQSKSK